MNEMILPKITSAFLNVTDNCNLCCRYCFVKQNPRRMSLGTAKRAADFLVENYLDSDKTSNPFITFFGGEPLLEWSTIIVPLTEYVKTQYKDINFGFSITTNGTLLDEEKLHFMKQNNIGLLLSIDGDKETQDYNRPCKNGKSSFDALESILPIVLKTFPDSLFRATLIPETCHNLFSNIMFAKDIGYSYYFTVPNVFEQWSSEDEETVQNDIRKYSDYFINSFRENKRPIIVTLFNECFKNIPRINDAIITGAYRSSKRCHACSKCGIGSGICCGISCDGNIYTCQEVSSHIEENECLRFGDIYNGVDETKRNEIVNRFNIHEINEPECKTCRLNRICDGHCLINNYLLNGSFNKPTKIYCWWLRLILEESIYITQVLGKEENEEFKSYLNSIM